MERCSAPSNVKCQITNVKSQITNVKLALGIIFLPAHLPQIRLHRLLAVSQVALCEEVDLVLGDFHQVLFARLHHLRHRPETVACLQLLRAQRRCAFHFLTQVQSVAVAVLRCRRAVCREQHLLAAMLRVLTRLCQCAGYTVYSG